MNVFFIAYHFLPNKSKQSCGFLGIRRDDVVLHVLFYLKKNTYFQSIKMLFFNLYLSDKVFQSLCSQFRAHVSIERRRTSSLLGVAEDVDAGRELKNGCFKTFACSCWNKIL